jgi:hypothetical protein
LLITVLTRQCVPAGKQAAVSIGFRPITPTSYLFDPFPLHFLHEDTEVKT